MEVQNPPEPLTPQSLTLQSLTSPRPTRSKTHGEKNQTAVSLATPARSRFSRAPRGGLELGERDAKLLCDLFLHRALTREQIQRLHFGSVQRCNARLRKLYDFGFVHRHYLALAPWGSPAIYFPAKAAASHIARQLEKQGLEVEGAEIERVCRINRAPAFLEHTLAVADFYLQLREAVENSTDGAPSEVSPGTGGFSLERWLPESLCRHDYDIRQEGGGEGGGTGRNQWLKEIFKPDAFFRLRQRRDGQQTFHSCFLEIDLGHVSSKLFGAKWKSYRRYLESGLFQEGYGERGFQVMVITTGPLRLSHLKALVEEASEAAGVSEPPFWLSTFENLSRNGVLGAMWQRPFEEEAVTFGA